MWHHRHLFHTWAILTNKTRYLTWDRTPLASMAYFSVNLYLPLYSWSSWLKWDIFSLRIHSQQLTGGLIALNCYLIVDCCRFPFLKRSSRYIYFRLFDQNKKTKFDCLLVKVKHFEGKGHGIVNNATAYFGKEVNSLLILGQSGTGKSHMVKEIALNCLEMGNLYKKMLLCMLKQGRGRGWPASGSAPVYSYSKYLCIQDREVLFAHFNCINSTFPEYPTFLGIKLVF